MTVPLGLGATIHVSAALPATEDQAGYEALTFTKVTDVTEIGGGGGSAASVDYVDLESGIKISSNGAITYDTRTIQLGDDITAAANAIIQSAFDGATKGEFQSYKVEKADGSTEYFNGPVGSYTKATLTADAYTFGSCDLKPAVKSVYVAAP